MVDREQGSRADRAEDRTVAQEQGRATEPAATAQLQGSDEDREFERAMELGRKVMKDHHAVLAALAK
jgi:general stress protein YciG